MQNLIDLLHAGAYSCVIQNKEVRTYSKPGIIDLYELLQEEKEFLKGAVIADKIIGKGAAGLLILGGVKKVYADTITLSALKLLRESGIETEFGEIIHRIQNRDKTGWCPIDSACQEEQSPDTILLIIETFINRRN